MLSQQHREEFETRGLLKVSQAISIGEATRMAGLIRDHLATPESVRRNSEQAFLAEAPAGFRHLTRSGAFDAVDSGLVPMALDELYGPHRWQRPLRGGRVLVTLRVPDRHWDVPHRAWHLDGWMDLASGEPSAVTVFTILTPLRPRGGGTLVVTGSHRLLQQHLAKPARVKAIRKGLGARHRWLRDLWTATTAPDVDRRRRYLDEGAVLDGVPLRVVELTGEPGDAYLMRADTFHAAAPNSLDDPRIMLVKGCPISRQDA